MCGMALITAVQLEGKNSRAPNDSFPSVEEYLPREKSISKQWKKGVPKPDGLGMPLLKLTPTGATTAMKSYYVNIGIRSRGKIYRGRRSVISLVKYYFHHSTYTRQQQYDITYRSWPKLMVQYHWLR